MMERAKIPHGRYSMEFREEALRRSSGSKKTAARLLRISRDSFFRYVKNCGSGRDLVTLK
jgi:hypothetical protein